MQKRASVLPEITHLQFLVLGSLRGGELPGLTIRRMLTDHGIRRSGPAFYQMMSRLEESELVRGRYRQKVTGGQTVTERRYEPTSAGSAAWEKTCEFYAAYMPTADLHEAEQT